VASARTAIEKFQISPLQLAACLPEPRRVLGHLPALLGPRYGDRGDSGFSPTEDEFNEAELRNNPIIRIRTFDLGIKSYAVSS
jgi:hypothetical protein